MKLASRAAIAALVLPVFAASAAHADDTPVAPEVLVTAGVEPLPTKQVASSFTIITAADIETFQYRDVVDALKSVPGLHVVQSGSRGSQTSIFTRGASSNQTLVMVNGLPVNDPASPGGAANLANIPLDNVERIEVVRGPQSALYGSQAMGGVVNIITRTGGEKPVTTLRVEGGTLGTLNTHASTGGATGNVDYFLSLSREATNGSDVTPARLRDARGKEKDGNEVVSASGRIGAKLNEHLSVSAFVQYTDSDTDIDDDGATAGFVPVFQNFDSTYRSKRLLVSGDVAGSFLDNKWRPKFSVGVTQYKSQLDDNPDPGGSIYLADVEYKGQTVVARFENALDIHPQHLLTFGGSYMRDDYSSNGLRDFGGFVVTSTSDADADAFAVYAADHMNFGERFFATVSLHHDMPDDLKNHTSYTVAPGYYHPETDTRLTASYGTGFKTPSLYQRYGNEFSAFLGFPAGQYTGNPNLKPETSRGWEVGIEQGLAGGKARAGATWFESRVKDAIEIIFDPFTGDSTAANLRRFDVKGFESFIEITPIERLTARIDYTWMSLDTNTAAVVGALTRRPRHEIGFTASWQPRDGTVFATNVQWVDPDRDIPRDGFGFYVYPASYTIVNVAASHRLTESIQLTARINNLLDKTYEPAHGLEAPGIEALAGIAFSF
ncbi:MAG: TonB-dependent receptor [Parvibaculum sp.]|uniref:TonB-dependent receptor plug domain-containing protein n=1 Tax=Parvibaculum sp. TaxID=2024848 RepID=UPI00272423DF|nr:TonB-dependent receptor [Parvibaculum sp.]MDO8838625.1 TonB-dependent receptor [Parvibaculum sp.]